MPRDKGLDDKMNQIAHFVADRILENQALDKEINDAWKNLTTYWTQATKLDKVGDDDDATNSGGFDGIKLRIANAGKADESDDKAA